MYPCLGPVPPPLRRLPLCLRGLLRARLARMRRGGVRVLSRLHAAAGGCADCGHTRASTAAAVAQLRLQLDPHNVASRLHYRGNARHGPLPPDRVCCTAVRGGACGMSESAARWFIEQASKEDAAGRIHAAAAASAAGAAAEQPAV